MNNIEQLYAGANRLTNVKFSAIRKVLDQAQALRDKGREVIALSAGEPNFNTPEPIKKAAIKAIEDNYTHYGSNRGLLKLRKIISDRILKQDNVFYDPKTEIVLTTGGAEALNNIILATVDEGDEVLVFSPAFVTYKNLVNMCGAKCIELPLTAERQFQPDIEELEKAITTHTKMLIMNNPNNPTGAVYSEDILREICKLAVKHNFLILSDEMYSSLVYEGKFVSIASFPQMKKYAIIVNGFSKTYAMTGWRLGYLQADARLVSHIMKVHQYSSTCSPTFIQVGLAAAIESSQTQEIVNDMVKEFKNRRLLLIDKLNKIEGCTFVKPQGAFYVMIDVSSTGLTGEEFTTKLLEEKNVAVVPVVSMGKDQIYSNYIRVSFAASSEDISKGIELIGETITSLCKLQAQ